MLRWIYPYSDAASLLRWCAEKEAMVMFTKPGDRAKNHVAINVVFAKKSIAAGGRTLSEAIQKVCQRVNEEIDRLIAASE